MTKQTFYGLRAHLRVCWPGIIVEMDLAPANVDELRLAEELLREAQEGWVLGERNYCSPEFAERLGEEGLSLLAPYKSKKREGRPWPSWLVQKRRRIEALISQITERYRAKRVSGRVIASAPHLALAAQGVEPHHGRLFLPASRTLSAPLRATPYRLNLHIGLARANVTQGRGEKL